MNEEVKLSTNVDEFGRVSTNIGVQTGKKPSSADANIKKAMGLLNQTVNTNKTKRDRTLRGSIDNNDVLFDKAIWSLLEEFLIALFRNKTHSFKDIKEELETNEKLSKELIVSQFKKSIDENDMLTNENKMLLEKKLLSEHIQNDLLKIAQYKHNQNIQVAKDVVRRTQGLNPYASKEDLTNAIKDELNLNMRGYEVFAALASNFKQKTTKQDEQIEMAQIQQNKKIEHANMRK